MTSTTTKTLTTTLPIDILNLICDYSSIDIKLESYKSMKNYDKGFRMKSIKVKCDKCHKVIKGITDYYVCDRNLKDDIIRPEYYFNEDNTSIYKTSICKDCQSSIFVGYNGYNNNNKTYRYSNRSGFKILNEKFLTRIKKFSLTYVGTMKPMKNITFDSIVEVRYDANGYESTKFIGSYVKVNSIKINKKTFIK